MLMDGQAEGTARGKLKVRRHRTRSMWGLPLQFHFVGFGLAVHGVRHPTVFSAQGSVGGSTKAQLGLVPSRSGCWPAGRVAGSGPISLRMPTQHARQTKRGWRRGWGWTARLQLPPGAPHPGRAEAAADREDGVCLPSPSGAVLHSSQVPYPLGLAPPSPPCSSVHPLVTFCRWKVLVCLPPQGPLLIPDPA